MAKPTEYCIKYTYTSRSNTNTGVSSSSTFPAQASSLDRSVFTVSGNTNVSVGKITRIVYKHPHTSTGRPTWQMQGRMTLSNGSILVSDIQSASFNANIVTVTNTFTDVPEDAGEATAWTSIATYAIGTDGGALYWRASTDYPVEVYIYFYDLSALVDGATRPVINSVALGDKITLPDSGGSIYNVLGYYVSGHSSPTFTFGYSLDANYEYITADHKLTVTSSSGATIYTSTVKDVDPGTGKTGTITFNMGIIEQYGDSLGYKYVITDNAGNKRSASGTFKCHEYISPSIVKYTSGSTAYSFVERYASRYDDGNNVYYEQADDGQNVRFSFAISVDALCSDKDSTNYNGWALAITYGTSGGSSSTTQSISASTADSSASTSTALTAEWIENRNVLSVSIDSSSAWTFTIVLTDKFGDKTYASMNGSVDEAGAFFDVEKTGVSVGMRSEGSESEKRFEVAGDYVNYFYGGIAQVGDVLNSLVALGVQCGSVSDSTVSANSRVEVDVAFPRKYVKPPTVIVTPTMESTPSDSYMGRNTVVVTDVDEIGFTAYKVSYGSAATYGFNWIAIGEINADPNAIIQQTYKLPLSPMTSANSGGLSVSASSTWSSGYPVYKAFDNDLNTSWASEANAVNPVITITFLNDVKLSNIKIKVYGRNSSYIHNPLDGVVEGYDETSNNWVQIGSFSGWSETARGTLLGTIECSNETTEYGKIRIRPTRYLSYDNNYVAIGNIKIEGIRTV